MSCSKSIEVSSPVMVDAHIRRWTLCSDDIHLIKFNEAPPGWLDDIINNIIDDSGLADDVGDLEDRFSNFEEGYTEHFYDWVEGDKHTLAYVENIYTTNGAFNAGLQEIKIAYVSHNEAGAIYDNLMGAWMTGIGGAWFNERVSVVSNVAYSAAKSVSTLTASMGGQQDQLNEIRGDIDDLEKQVDGKIETWRGAEPVITPQGDLIPTAEPYATWLSTGLLAEHTGDTYLHTSVDANGNDTLLGVYRFGKDAATGLYNWYILEDDLAAQAYAQALAAGVLADGKINSYYQSSPPTLIQDETLGEGDLWTDSDDQNKLYRYNGTDWVEISDIRVEASVNRLDEATVTIGGHARAKSSLTVSAGNSVSGFVLDADNSTSSEFRIYADKFVLASTADQPAKYAPFTVDTVTRDIKFNGVVTFENIEGGDDILKEGDAAGDINSNITTINGGKITTNSLSANKIMAHSVWTDGTIVSSDFGGTSYTGYVPNGSPAGFMLNGSAGAGSYNYPNIYGSYIRGGTIAASIIKFGGALLESECSEGGHYGKGNVSSAYNVSWNKNQIPSNPVYVYTQGNAHWLHGPCYGYGHLDYRILSLTKSSCVVVVSGFAHVSDNGGHYTYLEYQTYTPATGEAGEIWGAWTQVGHQVRGGSGYGSNPTIHISINFSSLMHSNQAIRFRGKRWYDQDPSSSGNIEISYQLNN